MGVKVYYQFNRGASLYSGAGAYKALLNVEASLNGRNAPKTKTWRKEITPLFERLCARYGRGSVGDLFMVKTRNPKKFDVYMGKKAKKKKLEVPRLRAVPRPTWAVPGRPEARPVTVVDLNEAALQLAIAQREREMRAAFDNQAATVWDAPPAQMNVGLVGGWQRAIAAAVPEEPMLFDDDIARQV